MGISEKYRNKKICILGFGLEGKATYDYLTIHGLTVSICDSMSSQVFEQNYPNVVAEKLFLGESFLDHLLQFDVIFKTPGISPLRPELVEAANAGVIITSQIQEFMDLCPCKTVGVTGTKGKGTTSTIIYQILKAAGKDVYLGGNIGTPALSFIDQLTSNSIVVLELSSFQLQLLKKSPNIAVMLNVTSEHLDYHKDTAEYRSAKANLLKYQEKSDIAIINADYDVTMELSRAGVGSKLYFSRYKEVSGCYVDDNDNIILKYHDIDTILATTSEIQLRGRHNLENITAASLAGSVLDIDSQVISRVIKNFTGLEHRLELVREVDGIKYYNDSFSTVPETAVAALNSFSEPVVLIAGGSSKKSDFSELGKVIAKANLRALILIGETAKDINNSISEPLTAPIITDLTNMSEIVKVANEFARPGDVVLLSPASASFGLFKNYKDRGNQFKEIVNSL